MRKKVGLFLMAVMVSLTLTAGIHAAVHSPKNPCYDASGKRNTADKSCDPNACGCFFHEIEEFVKDFIKGL